MNRNFLFVFKSFLLLAVMSFLEGCYYDQVEEKENNIPVSFSADIQPIFENNCTVCHPSLQALPDFTEGSSYNSLINGDYVISEDLDGSILYQRLLGNPSIMPPSGSLPAADINLVKNWIEQGAKNN